MTHTVRSLKTTDHTASQYRACDVSGIYSERSPYYSRPSPTPSWRKPDPSQWRYQAHIKK